MLFTEHFFILYFFPLFLILYLLFSNVFYRNLVIIIFSLIFYATFGIYNLWIFIIPLVIDYLGGIFLFSLKKQTLKKLLLAIIVIGNLLLLGYYKYFLFLNSLLLPLQLDLSRYGVFAALVPLGISFITFQRISYIVDIYRNKISPEYNLLRYATYASLFPHLISGPIVRYSNIKESLRFRIVNRETIFEGSKYFILGFFMKIAVADRLFLIEQVLIKRIDHLLFFDALLLIITFSLRIYIDFVGYSLIAIGLAKYMGFNFPENFISPYQSKSITEFWRRWNITLSNWLRDYLYIPLGGNRKGNLRTYINLLITMILGGLWHGANWNFMIWGLLHGVYLTIERLFQNSDFKNLIPNFLRIYIVFLLVSITWLTFLFQTPSDILKVLQPLFSLSIGMPDLSVYHVVLSNFPSLIIALIWSFWIKEANIKDIKPNFIFSIVLTMLFLFSLVLSFISESVPFIYFQF